jgi:twitching motility protein PilI
MARAAKLDLRTFQQELAARLATKTTAQVESSRLGLASGGERWLVRLADAGEVTTLPNVVPVPLTRPWYLGVANIRGNLFSVIDFSAFLGRESGLGGGQSRLVLFGQRVGEMNAGNRRAARPGTAQHRGTGAGGSAAGCAGVVCAALDGR